MQTPHADTLKLQSNVDDNHKQNSGNEPLIKWKQIPGTPFNILYKDNTYTLTLGNNLITTGFNTEEELVKHIAANEWNITTTLIMIIIQKMKEQDTNEKLPIPEKQNPITGKYIIDQIHETQHNNDKMTE